MRAVIDKHSYGRDETPWVSIVFSKDESAPVQSIDVACEACEETTTLFVDPSESEESVVQRVNEEYERHRKCAELVIEGNS